MTLIVCGIRDVKNEAFLQPYFSNARGAAIRAFGDEFGPDSKSHLAKHPSDYLLYELGSFDDNSGEFVPVNPIKLMANGADYISAKVS